MQTNLIAKRSIPGNLLHRSNLFPRQFFAEASELQPYFGIERLFNDSCDEGIVVHGTTGKKVAFCLVKTDTEQGEVRFWRFETIDAKWSLVVYND